MIIIGITGSIGMGKSTIANMLKKFNIPIFDSDEYVKKHIENNILVKKKIMKKWPQVTITHKKEKKINKTILGNIIFSSSTEKNALEKIIHPIIKVDREDFIKKHTGKEKFVALDVPLLYETNTNQLCDFVFLAITSEKKQKCRVLSRKNMTEKKFYLIKQNQLSEKEKISRKPYLISTSYGKIVTFVIVLYYLIKIIIKQRN